MKKKLFLLCLTGAMVFCEPVKAESVTNVEEAISKKSFAHIVNDTFLNRKHDKGRKFDHIGNDTFPSKNFNRRGFDHIGNYNIYSENQSLVTLYPNPTINNLSIKISVDRLEKIQLKILDNTGRILKQEIKNLLIGSTTIAYVTTNLPKGIYYIHLLGETINECKEFIKQ